MSSRHKEQIKALKEPDTFQTYTMRFLDWGTRNIRYLVMILVPIAIGVAGTFAWKYFQQRQTDARLAELGKIQVIYETEEIKASKEREVFQRQASDIDAKITTAQAQAPNAPVDPALEAQKTALNKQMEAIKADHAASVQEFQAFYEKYSAKPEGWVAGLTAVRYNIDKQKWPEARQVLENILKSSTGYPFYQVQARFVLIGVLEEMGDYAAAMSEAEQLDKIVDAEFKPRVLLTMGRLQMLKQANDEAKATLTKLIETYGQSPEAQKARSIQMLLN